MTKAVPTLALCSWHVGRPYWFFVDGCFQRDNLISDFKTCLHSNQISLLGVFVFSPTPTNVTVMFPTGAGVEVRLRNQTMTTTVLLPTEFTNSTLGLLGKMNGDTSDDLSFSNGSRVQNYSNPDELFSFGASCKKLFAT